MTIKTDISFGEFLDKLTILQIKQQRITDTDKLVNINRELQALTDLWEETSSKISHDISADVQALKKINEVLWEIEDRIRDKEVKAEFDDEFIQLARCVYITNDERAVIKRRINEALSSDFIEEKSYTKY